MGQFFQLVISGFALGCIYAIVALGFVIIYKSSGVINFAQGELMMVGAYFCYFMVVHLHLSYITAFVLTMGFSVALGLALERVVLRRLIGESVFAVIMVTIGLSTIFRSSVGLILGHEEHRFPSPFPENPIRLGGTVISHTSLWTIVITLFFLFIFFLFFKYTTVGVGMRATADDQDTAQLMGISVKKIFAMSWVIATVVASIGGISLAEINFLYPHMSFIGLKAFPAAILGGMDSIFGAILGGIIIGLAETLSGGYIDQYVAGGVSGIMSFIILILVLMVKPYGFFGTEEIERV